MSEGTDPAARPPLLRVRGLRKAFPGSLALDDVSLDVHGGEVVAVIGHNGSGKSTLVKILAGVHTADAGSVALLDEGGEPTELHFIHQDLGLIPPFSTVENLDLGRGSGAAALAPHRAREARARARELVGRFGAPFDVTVPVASLSAAQRSIVAIARALDSWRHPRNVLVLDEPTEALHASEVQTLFDAVRRLAADGAGVVFISHRLDEVLALADRVVVLRNGQVVADEPRAGLDHDRLVELLLGATLHAGERRTAHRVGEDVALRVRGLSGRVVQGLDLDLRPGEVVGVAGLLGSGREEVPAMLFGAVPSSAEVFEVAGRDHPERSPAGSIRAGLAFVAGDRGRLGAVGALNARENITLPRLRPLRSRFGAVSLRRERAETGRLVADFGVLPARPEQTFALFSGGNQQKIVMAKWLRNEPTVLLLEEPTQGVDIGAKAAIYAAVDAAAAEGTAVLVCSSDDKELLRLCDRVLVLRGGRLAAELSGAELTENRLVLEAHGLLATARPATAPPATAAIR